MKAVILAGGLGKRLGKLIGEGNKCMVKLFEKPLIEYNLEHAHKSKVNEIIVVLYYRPEEIMDYVGNNYKGTKVSYVVEKEGKGLVEAINNAREKIGDSDFILMLGDELVLSPDIKGMIKKFKKEDCLAICGTVYEDSKESIGKTYTAMVNENMQAFRLIEKPKVKINNIKGTGHCVLRNEMLNYIDRTPINAIRGQKELVDLIQVAIDDGKKVLVYPVSKDYTNVNTLEDYELVKEMIRKNNPKVLIVHNQMKYFGGAELLIVEMANWLTKMGIKNDILALSSSREVEEELINTEVITINNDINLRPPGYRSVSEVLKAIKIFRKRLNEIKDDYDVINFHDFPVTWSLWPRKKPAVWFMNLPPNLWSKPDAGFFYKMLNKFRVWLDRVIVRGSIDVITVAEEANLERSKDRYGKNPRMVNFGINYDFFSNGDAKKAIDKFKLRNKFVVMQSGILNESRNQLGSVKTINQLKGEIPNILLILTGRFDDHDYKKRIEEYIKKNKLDKHVLLAGNLATREELRDLFKAADVGLFPMRGQGGVLVPLEMLSAGMSIIVSEEMETASFIKKNGLGIVTKDYAKAVLEIYNNLEKYKEKAKKRSLFVRDNLSWRAFASNMAEAFRMAWKKYR